MYVAPPKSGALFPAREPKGWSEQDVDAMLLGDGGRGPSAGSPQKRAEQQAALSAAMELAAHARKEEELQRQEEEHRGQIKEHRRQLELHELQLRQQREQRRLLSEGFRDPPDAATAVAALPPRHPPKPSALPSDPAAYAAHLVAAARAPAPGVPPLVAADDAWWGGWVWAAEAQQLAKSSPPEVAQIRGEALDAAAQARTADKRVEKAEEAERRAAEAAAEDAAMRAQTAAAEVMAARAAAAAAAAAAEALAAKATEAEADAIAASEVAAVAKGGVGGYRAAGGEYSVKSPVRGSGAAAVTEQEALSTAHGDAREIRLRLMADITNEQKQRAETAAQLLASIAPSSAAIAAAAALAEAEAKANLAAQAQAVGADMVAERRQREATEAFANAEELAKRAAQSAGREVPAATSPSAPATPLATATGSAPAAAQGEPSTVGSPSSPTLLSILLDGPQGSDQGVGRLGEHTLGAASGDGSRDGGSRDGSGDESSSLLFGGLRTPVAVAPKPLPSGRLPSVSEASHTSDGGTGDGAAAGGSGFAGLEERKSFDKPQLRRTPITKPKRGKAKGGADKPDGGSHASTVVGENVTKGVASSTGADPAQHGAGSRATPYYGAPPSTPPSAMSSYASGGWALTDIRRGGQQPSDPFWEGGSPSPLEPHRLGRLASASKLAAPAAGDDSIGGVVLHPAPLTSSLSIIKATAAASAGPRHSAAATAEVDVRADAALQRSRARAEEAKARLQSSPPPVLTQSPGAALGAWSPSKFDTSASAYYCFAEDLLPTRFSSPSKRPV